MSTEPAEPVTQETPSQIRTTLLVLSIGLGLMLVFAYVAEAFFDRAHMGSLFFLIPVVGFLVPMLLSSARLPAGSRRPAMLLSLAAAVVAAGTLVAAALLTPVNVVVWLAGAVVTVAVGLAGAMAAGRGA